MTINQGQVAGGTSLTNFPVLFSVTDPNLATTANGGGVGNANGSDILFTASDGVTKLNHEVEYYNGTTGQLIAWVQVPALLASANTGLYVYYGNAGAAPQWDPSGVWGGYQRVWHLANGTSLSVADSTSSGNNGINSGAVAVSGHIDGGAGFNGSSSFITIPPASFPGYPTSGSTSTYQQTTEVWFKTASYGVILAQDDGTAVGSQPSGWVPTLFVDLNGKLRASLFWHGSTSLEIVSANSYNDNNWHHAVDVYNNGTETLFVDGVAQGSQTVTENGYSNTYGYSLGAGDTASWTGGLAGWMYLNGSLDEVRVSNTARTAGWIETEYNNQHAPSTFLTEGPQQNSGQAPAASIQATSGTPQSTTVGTVFGTTLQAAVESSGGTPVSGVTVTFTAPGSGASATFGGSTTVTEVTNSAGVATAPAPTADSVAGSYTVTATVSGVASGASFNLTNTSGSTAWYNGGWVYRKAVTINQSQVAGGTSLTNFPVLFSVTDPNLATTANGGGVGNANGSDILFTASDGVTKLNHEVEYYNGTTGQLIAWVQVPALLASANTGLYVYYGNAGAAPQWDPSGVWGGYQGVWHLANGTSLSVADSTSSGNNGINSGAVAVSGHIDGGAGFNGSSSFITIPPASFPGYPTSGSTSTYQQTTEVWFKTASYGVILAQDDGTAVGSQPSGWVPTLFVDLNGKLRASLFWHGSTSLEIVSANSYNDNNWHHAVDVYNNGTETLFVDGVAQGSQTVTENGYSNTYGYSLGAGDTASWTGGLAGWMYLNGSLDEVRVSNTARTAGWIETEYNNQHAPSTFLTEGPQQSGS